MVRRCKEIDELILERREVRGDGSFDVVGTPSSATAASIPACGPSWDEGDGAALLLLLLLLRGSGAPEYGAARRDWRGQEVGQEERDADEERCRRSFHDGG